MTLRASKRAEEIVQAEIRNMSVECDRVGGVNLSQGICDLEVPLPVRRGAQKAMDQGVNQYTRYDGLPELRRSISKKMREFNGIQADPEEHIVVSAGSTGAFYSAGMALHDPGDEVILFEPYYGHHLNTLWALRVVPAYARLTPPDWTFQVEELESLVNEKTRGILINTPANPSGKVFAAEELRRLAQYFLKGRRNHGRRQTWPDSGRLGNDFILDHRVRPATGPHPEATFRGLAQVAKLGQPGGFCTDPGRPGIDELSKIVGPRDT